MENRTSVEEFPCFSIFIPYNGEVEYLFRLIENLQEENLKSLQMIYVLDDTSNLSLSNQFINLNIKVLHSDSQLGKHKNILEAAESVLDKYILCLDVDVYWEIGKLSELLKSELNFDKITLFPIVENFQHSKLKFLQSEEAAIKLLTYVSAYNEKPLMASAASFFASRQVLLELLNNYNTSFGWDMYLVKFHSEKLHFLYPQKNNILYTNAEPSFKKYFKQRSRWLSNSFNSPKIGLLFIGTLVFLSYLLDFLMIFLIPFFSLKIGLLLSSILIIKMITIFYLVHSFFKFHSIRIKVHHFLFMHLYYGLNIGIILIFLVLFNKKK